MMFGTCCSGCLLNRLCELQRNNKVRQCSAFDKKKHIIMGSD